MATGTPACHDRLYASFLLAASSSVSESPAEVLHVTIRWLEFCRGTFRLLADFWTAPPLPPPELAAAFLRLTAPRLVACGCGAGTRRRTAAADDVASDKLSRALR